MSGCVIAEIVQHQGCCTTFISLKPNELRIIEGALRCIFLNLAPTLYRLSFHLFPKKNSLDLHQHP